MRFHHLHHILKDLFTRVESRCTQRKLVCLSDGSHYLFAPFAFLLFCHLSVTQESTDSVIICLNETPFPSLLLFPRAVTYTHSPVSPMLPSSLASAVSDLPQSGTPGAFGSLLIFPFSLLPVLGSLKPRSQTSPPPLLPEATALGLVALNSICTLVPLKRVSAA